MTDTTQAEVQALRDKLKNKTKLEVDTSVPAITAATPTVTTDTDAAKLLKEKLQKKQAVTNTTPTDLAAITPVEDLGAPTTALDEQSRVVFDITTGDATGPAMPPRADAPVTEDEDYELSPEVQALYDTGAAKLEEEILAGKYAPKQGLVKKPTDRTQGYGPDVSDYAQVDPKDKISRADFVIQEYDNMTIGVNEFLKDPNPLRQLAAKELVKAGVDIPTIYWTVTLADYAPIVGGALAATDVPQSMIEARNLIGQGKYGQAAGIVTLTGFDVIASAIGAGVTTRSAINLGKRISKARTLADLANVRTSNKAGSAFLAELENAEVKNAANAKIVEENTEISQMFIDEFEARTGKTISITVNGVKKLDGDLARKAGVETAQAVGELQTGANGVQFNQLAGLATGGDELVQPILKPEKFNAIVALAADLKKRKPEAFAKDKPIIDVLFESTVNQDIVGGQELVDMLNKYGLSFEDYVLTVVGSGSEAGKVLNKLSQIARVRPAREMDAIAAEATNKANGQIRDFVMRVENIRRGGLVSQVATAARNLTSGVIRAPLESLGNVMDTALYNLSNEGLGKAAVSLVSPTNWKDSFRQMKYMFSRSDIAKDYTDLILDRPELAKQYESMFNNVSEIQKMTGRGTGGAVDKVLSEAEDVVTALNTPNRWQEYLIRRGAFFGELERITRREWGIDLKEVIDNGKIRDLLNDSSEFKPTKGRSFIDLVDDSTRKALDITYAKQPDIPVFQATSTFITRNGLTVVMPFPRFMFNSMELMGQYAGGASIPLTRKMTQLVTGGKVGAGPLTAKDRQRITRNLIGFAAIGAAYSYRTSEDAPADYKAMKADDDTIIDTTAQYPMRQFLYLGEATKRVNDGTFNDWFDHKEFVQTFVGTNVRTGVGQSLIQEVADLATGTDLTSGESAGKLLGGALGNYLSTWVVPFGQIIDAQRVVGERGTVYKESAKDPTLDFMGTFTDQIKKPFKSRGLGLSPQEEAALTNKEYVLTEDRERVSPLTKLLFGISMTTANTEEGEYLADMGFTEMDVSSRSRVPTVRNFENKILREALPTILNALQGFELDKRSEYQDKTDKFKDSTSEDAYVNTYLKPIITKQLSNVKSKIASGAQSKATPYVMAMSKYRGLNADLRKWATVRFREEYDKDPDGSSTKDLQTLYILGDAYGKAIR